MKKFYYSLNTKYKSNEKQNYNMCWKCCPVTSKHFGMSHLVLSKMLCRCPSVKDTMAAEIALNLAIVLGLS